MNSKLMRKANAAPCAATMIAAQETPVAAVDLVNPPMGTDPSYELS